MRKVILFSIFFILLIGLSAAADQTLGICRKDCNIVQKNTTSICLTDYNSCRQACTNSLCKRDCNKVRTICTQNVSTQKRICEKACLPQPKPITCLNGTYNKGEFFTQGCNFCQCNEQGKIICKQDPFCNKSPAVDKQTCTSAGGLYQPLCNGPYFDIVCSAQQFCICQGANNYSCPSDYSCLTNFISPNKRIHTVSGWRDLLGKDLGNIGVCVQND